MAKEAVPEERSPAPKESARPKARAARRIRKDPAEEAAFRESRRAVRLYLEAIERHRPRQGRQRTQESIERRVAQIEEMLASVDSMSRLHLIQERLTLMGELQGIAQLEELGELEAQFVLHAEGYGERSGVSYEAWRQIGVSRQVLREAGIQKR